VNPELNGLGFLFLDWSLIKLKCGQNQNSFIKRCLNLLMRK